MSPFFLFSLFSFRKELTVLFLTFATALVILPIVAFAMIIYMPKGVLLEFREAFDNASIPVQYLFGVGNAVDDIKGTSIWPMRGYTTKVYSLSHKGMDISTGGGKHSNIRAFMGGKVEKVVYDNSKKSYGNHIIIDHKDGLWSLYAHLDKIYVEEGQEVPIGYEIGLEGNTGKVEGDTGIHLHFEIRALKWASKDPLDFISGDPLYDLNK